MKILFMILLFFTFSFSKECYFNKVNNICYYKYFKKSNIHKPKANEEYYMNKRGQIYTFDNIIEVKFNSIGGIFTILNDFELEFVDKIKKEVYLFKVEDKRDYFPIISQLNRLKAIMKAQPYRTRKYTKLYIKKQQEAKRARFEAAMKKANRSLSNKRNNKDIKKKDYVPMDESLMNSTGGKGETKSFLKGNAQ